MPILNMVYGGGGGGGGWKPGSSTIVYIPMEGDVKDYSGNSRDGTATTITYQTLTSGLVVANFTQNNSRISLPSLGEYTQFTTSIWLKFSGNNSYIARIWVLNGNNGGRTQFQPRRLNSSPYCCQLCTWNGSTEYRQNLGTNNVTSWTNLIITFSNGLLTGYINGTQLGTLNSNFAGGKVTMTDCVIGAESGTLLNSWGGQMSRAIIENKIWTADEITAYYNQTKGDYGIS